MRKFVWPASLIKHLSKLLLVYYVEFCCCVLVATSRNVLLLNWDLYVALPKSGRE
ncbi:hypothetical protein RND71_037717 [Anisodus tanguticus]|uniref:Uncharacterized protein n=1 Tax=Anisodus tanguticus TaxID=243964 RepID=A0AAE1QYM7_9SOLA|nr:hypothetical protein RND71_037717 [Anisodus tanguticus]